MNALTPQVARARLKELAGRPTRTPAELSAVAHERVALHAYLDAEARIERLEEELAVHRGAMKNPD